MADGFVQLPVDSSGKKLRTVDKGAAGHDQYVVIADGDALGSYRCATVHVGATAAAKLVSFENPAASGKVMSIIRLYVTTTAVAATTAHANIIMGRTTALPSGGTTQTIQKNRTSDAAASAIVRVAPTTTEAAGSLRATTIGWGGTANVAPGFIEMIEGDTPPLVLVAGEAISLRTDGANDADYRFTVNFLWREL